MEGLPPQAGLNDEYPDDVRRLADLTAILEVARQLSASRDLDFLLATIEQACLRVLDCERAGIFLYDPASDELYSRVATGIGDGSDPGARGIRFPASQGIAGETLQTGAILNIPDAYADPRFNPAVDRRTGYRTRNILSCPLRGHDGSPVGVLQVLNKHGSHFRLWDQELIQIFSAQAGAALQRQLLLEVFTEQQRMRADMEAAKSIQEQLLPERPPAVPGFDLAGWNRPADQTGGDFYDFQEVADGRVAVALADVTGHGIGPALLAAECRALLRASMALTPSLERAVPLVNRLLSADIPEDRFATAFIGLLLPEEATCLYVSAGQAPLLFFRKAADTVTELPTSGFPLGILAHATYPVAEPLVFEPGDVLLLCTDGFGEWPDAERNRFGTERIKELVRAHHALSAAELIQEIHRAVAAFAGGMPQQDDLTAVVIKKC
jgi:phosphoserine phosphatase